MPADSYSLRAIVERSKNGGFQAKLVDFDIAVRADTEEGIFGAIEYALEATYEVAIEEGKTPFVSVFNPQPTLDADRWAAAPARQIKLPPAVSQALALILHYQHPVNTIALRKAA